MTSDDPMTVTARPLVSVITPVHNTESYLQECIESVLAQDYENWEYILVNNVSTDKSRDIALSYVERDSRIRLHDTDEYLEQVPNYNEALRLISPRSKYCKIVQADDWIFPQCLSKMVDVAETNSNVGIVSSYYLKGSNVGAIGLKYPSTSISGREVCRMHLLGPGFYFGSPTALLIRSDIVRGRDPFYSETSLHEDTEACYEILRTWDFGFIHQILSYLRTDNESISSRVASFNPHILSKLIVVKKYGPEFLTKDEYRHRWRKIERSYLQCIGEATFRFCDEAFWKYHFTGLQTINYTLNMRKRIWGIVLALLGFVLNLQDSLYRVKCSWKHKSK